MPFSAGTDLATFLTWLRHQRFTGTITLHIHAGLPRDATWGAPSKVIFELPQSYVSQGGPTPGLDKLSESRPHSLSEESPTPKRP